MSTGSAPSRTPRWAMIGLLGVFLLGSWLRLDAIGHLLPYLPEPDNSIATQLWNLEENVPPPKRPASFDDYPLLLADLARAFPAARPPIGDDLGAHLRAASTVTLRLRILTAAFSALLVLLTWSLARRWTGPAAAVLAAFFVAGSLLHLLFSQQARPHGAHATLALLAVLAAMRMRDRPTWRSHALAGIAALAAMACLQSGVAVLLPLAVAHFTREKAAERGRPSGSWIVTSILLVFLAAFAFYPPRSTPLLLDAEPTDGSIESTARQGTHAVHLSSFDGSGFVRIHTFLVDHDPALYALAILGIVLALAAAARRGWSREFAVPLAYAVPYALAVGAFRDSYERFLLPLLPYFACLAGYAVAQVAGAFARIVPHGPRRVAAALAVAAAPILFTGCVAWRYATVRDAPDAVERASEWIRENVDPRDGPILVTPELTMPLFHDPSTFENNLTPILASIWVRYQAELPPSESRPPGYRFLTVPWDKISTSPSDCPRVVESQFEQTRPAWAVIEVSARILNRMPIAREMYERVRERGELVFAAEGEPVGWPIERPLDYQNMPGMLRRLFAAECLGPRIEIWRLRGG